MRRIFLALVIATTFIGCKGKDGKDGSSGGSMQRIEGTNTDTTWGVQVDNFSVNDSITVYYALSSDTQTYFEMKGPETPPTSAPYYEFGASGTSALVRMHNLPLNSQYRILVFRPSTVI